MESTSGRDSLTNVFHLCTPLTNTSTTLDLYNWISTAYSYMAMADYPYPATFLGPMPSYPVSVAASFFSETRSSDLEILDSVRQAVNVYYNYSGQAGSCFLLSDSGPSTLDDAGGWNYQSCTEQVKDFHPREAELHDAICYHVMMIKSSILHTTAYTCLKGSSYRTKRSL